MSSFDCFFISAALECGTDRTQIGTMSPFLNKGTGKFPWTALLSTGRLSLELQLRLPLTLELRASITVVLQLVSWTDPTPCGRRLVYVPNSVAAAFYNSVGGSPTGTSGQYALPCGSTATVGLSFGGVNYQMPLEDLNLGCEFPFQCGPASTFL